MAKQLISIPGVDAVTLGGSRVRGTHRADSDWDLGVYYRRSELDLGALSSLAAEVNGSPVELAGPGEWGPWVDGGAWLSVDGVAVDWILRDLDRVRRIRADCRAGRYEVGVQPGHPLGFWSPAYAGEVALGRVLADRTGELTSLQAQTLVYPEPLRTALVEAAWEADFSVAAARKSVRSGDGLHVSLCLSRAFGILAQTLHAHERVWCINEKGALAAAAALRSAPRNLTDRTHAALTSLDAPAVEAAAELVREVRSATA
ncbi:nucleotidyltransferase domain-containing protein [Streptomyces sannanensis]